jgi:hypothetical protein
MRQRMGVGLLLALVACGGQTERATGPTGTLAPAPAPASEARGWQAPVRVGPSAGARLNDGDPHIAVDDQGRALAVWIERFQTGPRPVRLQAARFHPASGWGASQSLVDGLFLSRSIDLAMNRRGEAVAVVYDTADENHHSAALLSPDVGWSPPLHSSGFTASRQAKVAMAEDGRVAVLWQEQRDPGIGQPLLVGTISREHGWQLDGTLDASTPYLRGSLALAWDARGRAIAAWTEYANFAEVTPVFASLGIPGSGWSPPQRLSDTENHMVALGLAVATDREGNALAAWTVSQGLEVARLAPDSGWSPAVLLPDPWAGTPLLRFDRRGGAILVWGGRYDGLAAASFDPGRGWSPTQAQPVSADDAYVSGEMYDLGVDDNGRGIVVWSRDGRILASSFTAAEGWGPTAFQSMSGTGSRPRIAVNGRGEAFVVWSERVADGEELWSARYVP